MLAIGAACAKAQMVDLAPITVIGTDQPEASTDFGGIYTAAEYLAVKNSGVDIQERIGFGYLQDVSIRGGVFEDTRVSLNGVSLNNPQTGHYHLLLPVTASDLETVEADLNAQELAYRLKRPERSEGLWRAAGGSRGYAENAFSMTQQQGNAFHRFSAEGIRNDGLRDETDGHRLTGAYTYAQSFENQDLMVYAAKTEREFGADGAYSAPWYMKEEERLKQEFVMGQWRAHGDWEISLQPYVHRTQDIFF